MLLHLMLACKEPDGIKLDDSAVEESEVVDDSGTTDDSGDSDDSGEPTGTPVTFLLDGEWGGTTLSGTRFYFDNSNSLILGDGLFSALATSAELSVGVPDPTDLEPLPDIPGVDFAVFLVSLHQDEDGDGFPADEVITGIGRFWMVFLAGDESAIAGAFLEPGWNVLRTDVPDDIFPLDGIELSTNLLENESISAAGAYSGAEPVDGLGMAAIPQAEPVSSIVYDAPMTNPWSVTLSGIPPTDHFVDVGDGNVIALEFLLVYADNDNSNGVSEGDQGLHVVCDDAGDTISLIYLPEVTDLALGLTYVDQGLTAGWVGAVIPADGMSGPTILAESELLALSTCAADF